MTFGQRTECAIFVLLILVDLSNETTCEINSTYLDPALVQFILSTQYLRIESCCCASAVVVQLLTIEV